jgi:hypothetical protein
MAKPKNHPLPRFHKHQRVRYIGGDPGWDEYNIKQCMGYVTGYSEWRNEAKYSDHTYPAGYYLAVEDIGAWIWEGAFENADMRIFVK